MTVRASKNKYSVCKYVKTSHDSRSFIFFSEENHLQHMRQLFNILFMKLQQVKAEYRFWFFSRRFE